MDKHRRSVRLQDYDYSSSGAYFVTICTENKGAVFGRVENGAMVLNELGRIVEEKIIKSETIRAELEIGEFAIMPNHIHLIVWINPPNVDIGAHGRAPLRNEIEFSNVGIAYRKPKSLGAFVAGFKSATTKRINQIMKLPGVKLWQRNYYEHIIRTETDLNAIREYILNNPANWEKDEYYI